MIASLVIRSFCVLPGLYDTYDKRDEYNLFRAPRLGEMAMPVSYLCIVI